MRIRLSALFAIACCSVFAGSATVAGAGEPEIAGARGDAPRQAEEFFERRIRPALIEHCLDCHSNETELSGGLALDSRVGWMTGGDLGPAVIPGDPAGSLLMRVIRYAEPDLQMPPDGRLDKETISDFERWIETGAFDPRASATVTAERATGLPVE